MKKNKLIKHSPAKLAKLIKQPGVFSTICTFIAGGGMLTDYCKKQGVGYAELVGWIRKDAARVDRFRLAKGEREEWMKETVMREIMAISTMRTTDLFNEDHTIKPPSEWPELMPHLIAGLEVKEVWDWREEEDSNTGKIKKVRYQSGEIKKIKFWPKDKALEMAGKVQAMFADRREVNVHMTLEQMVSASFDEVTAKVVDVEVKEISAHEEDEDE